MCRLYGICSTHSTRVGCELIEAQNSLIRQSLKDSRGLANPHGWGIGYWSDNTILAKRQVGPASESQEFRDHARRIRAPVLLAHIRRATVGEPKKANTHPFLDDFAMMAHNGHIENFEAVRPKLLEALPEHRRRAIQGDTDSEHFFQLLRTYRERHPDRPLREIVRQCIHRVRSWTREVDEHAEVALNVIWVEGRRLAGARYGRTLWYMERRSPRRCGICGEYHAQASSDDPYLGVELASERLTHEGWSEMPRASVFEIEEDLSFQIEPLDP